MERSLTQSQMPSAVFGLLACIGNARVPKFGFCYFARLKLIFRIPTYLGRGYDSQCCRSVFELHQVFQFLSPSDIPRICQRLVEDDAMP